MLGHSIRRNQAGINRIVRQEDLSGDGGLTLAAKNLHDGSIDEDAQFHLTRNIRIERSTLGAREGIVKWHISGLGAVNKDLFVNEAIADKGLLREICRGLNSNSKFRSI